MFSFLRGWAIGILITVISLSIIGILLVSIYLMDKFFGAMGVLVGAILFMGLIIGLEYY